MRLSRLFTIIERAVLGAAMSAVLSIAEHRLSRWMKKQGDIKHSPGRRLLHEGTEPSNSGDGHGP
jgi:hypothetical protein